MIKNREKLIRVIREDCQIKHAYYIDGATCAIGGLAVAAGVDLKTLFEGLDEHEKQIVNETFIWAGDVDERIGTIQSAIEDEFGLDEDHQRNIQSINDVEDIVEIRQELILDYIATL